MALLLSRDWLCCVEESGLEFLNLLPLTYLCAYV